MRIKNNKKGDYTSEWFYFLVGGALVIIGLFLMMNMSDREKQDNYQQVASLKEGYQTIQLARTYLQTPMEFKGETREVANWANYYFNLNNYTEKNELRRALYDLAEVSIKPHLRTGVFESEASFTYYFLGQEQDKVIVASTWATSSESLQDKGIVYSDEAQVDVELQIPFYEKGDQFNPTDKYILFKIKTTDEKRDSNTFSTNIRR
ncbi:hypothetical protein JXA48_01495 [Candidatus Woesearchaeota archaeon]|nr:hypothetical protein [Candidatus Woesearchaeota archaeon]